MSDAFKTKSTSLTIFHKLRPNNNWKHNKSHANKLKLEILCKQINRFKIFLILSFTMNCYVLCECETKGKLQPKKIHFHSFIQSQYNDILENFNPKRMHLITSWSHQAFLLNFQNDEARNVLTIYLIRIKSINQLK